MKHTLESEKVLERSLKRCVERDLNGYYLKLLSKHISGLPDRLCLLPGGRVIFVELKTTKKQPSKIQLRWHKRIRRLGFRVEVLDSSQQIKELIEELTEDA